ncbi:hypothetical protein [Laspinema olomoucense]|uniref:hypothetical protein n=1 Tax=Laspinema olomoucense TaxID=3231600 RepID=UPI0021BB7046|nr:hypothetical protein [Laspinema sp. D3a]MCT7989494.1 hypothetical protein [Laspinema sp. D3a]
MEHCLVLCPARYKSFSEKPLPENFYQVAVWNRHYLEVLKLEIDWMQQCLVLEINR